MTTLTAATSPRDAGILVLGVASAGSGPELAVGGLELSTEQQQSITAAIIEIGATGRPDEVLRMPGEPYGLPPLLLTGVGPAVDLDAEVLRRAAGAALRAANLRDVAVALPTSGEPVLVEAAALGSLVGAYRFTEMRAEDPSHPAPERITVLAGPSPEVDRSLERARVIGEAVRLAKRLVDTPPGHLPPATLADEAVSALEGTGVGVEILDEAALATAGYGGILAVGQGSANPPRLVRTTYRPDGATKHLVLIGKGITFDSGGLSLKPPTGMIHMKSDMAGAAAVVAAVRAIALLGVPLSVTGYLAIAENMPSGSAQRPGDVITSYGGKTVEVLNTDAEGRLVLMDALARCAADEPDAIVDIATLTGAQLIALGTRIAGVMGNDDGWRAEVHASAEQAGELSWPMPIPEELRASLDSPVADIANMGERNGGMMTAAAFLREFVPAGIPWAHVDIAGPSFVETTPWAYNAKGATGFGVRTLVTLAERMAEARD